MTSFVTTGDGMCFKLMEFLIVQCNCKKKRWRINGIQNYVTTHLIYVTKTCYCAKPLFCTISWLLLIQYWAKACSKYSRRRVQSVTYAGIHVRFTCKLQIQVKRSVIWPKQNKPSFQYGLWIGHWESFPRHCEYLIYGKGIT